MAAVTGYAEQPNCSWTLSRIIRGTTETHRGNFLAAGPAGQARRLSCHRYDTDKPVAGFYLWWTNLAHAALARQFVEKANTRFPTYVSA
jgi:hypothetical protein